MAKTRSQKEAMLAQYKEWLTNSKGVIALEQSKIGPNDSNALKINLAGVSASYHIVKNTIFALAMKELEMPEMAEIKDGSHAVVFLGEDLAAGAKAINEFVKANKDKIKYVAGMMDGQLLSVAQVESLANLPSKEQSISMILGLLENSLTGVVNVLEDSMRSVVTILDKAYQGKN